MLALAAAKILYNVHFHPAAAYPGPLLARATRLYYMYYRMSGRLEFKIKELHDRYGRVVRVAPDERKTGRTATCPSPPPLHALTVLSQ